ncbi:hypothetical protein BN159_4996 [Streptomyces davaonensis JCM 4913]|uniref:DUF676 domain-containing protein n=1 Tax=Streptomyces davaonensis (strain DSM 101723 / JCM 4913 / KCC S-0913 / 768) TaxID=1214101 RepID=K4R8L0_STRDJ|nr:alpha/beta hydrolase [Streptomyces davaonensis]CCK29375.1 hypothetical protein BN159_4996 [Streptomyces davaonensis JCM 4913]
MQRLRRRLTLLLSVVLATVITMFTVTPAGAAPSRSNGDENRVVFVHGYAPDGSHDCAEYFRTARKHFANNGWEGNLLTFGYYDQNSNCSYKYRGTRSTDLKTVAKAFANWVNRYYTDNNKKIDVVAHSMGGLVVRAAIYYTNRHASGFPDKLYIEDVVTLGTPHGGTNWGNVCATWQQCRDMKPGSTFLDNLPSTMPNSQIGTDWTTVSSVDDGIVSETSGIAGTADHEVQYDDGIGHNELRTISSGSWYGRIKYSTTWTSWHDRISPVKQARLAVYYHSTT